MARKLIEVEEARRLVTDSVERLESERAALRDALGRVLAEDVTSGEPVPGFDNSAMDGFAVRAADTAGAAPGAPVRLQVVDESRAGRPATSGVRPGEAIRISTGAMLPEGADSIVRVEEASEREGAVETEVRTEPGRDVRRAGDDIEPGDVVLRAGATIGPAELGVLASVGHDAADCARRPRVAVVTTGDELLDPAEPMSPGGVRNTNAWALPALTRLAGAVPAGAAQAGDDPGVTREAIAVALEAADVAVISGGISVGEHDHVRGALAELGVEQRFWGVALRPGRPSWFGVHADGPGAGGSLVFGLPGNPVSAMVTFLLFVRPALRMLQGADPGRDRTTAILDSGYKKGPGRTHALRVRLELAQDGWHAEQTTEAQGSHILTSMLGADALAVIPAERESVAAGERVVVELLPQV